MDTFVQIGRSLKAHGLKGELKLNIEELYLDDLFEMNALFIEVKGQKIPYFIEELQEGNMLIVRLEEVASRTAAEQLAHKAIYLRREDITVTEAEMQSGGLQYKHLEGYMIVDATLGEIALIDEVAEFPQQEMAYINYQGKVHLIPMHPTMMDREDAAEKKIYMDLPEGLLEL